MMLCELIDSHCHLNQIDLSVFNGNLHEVLSQAKLNGVVEFLCVCITKEDIPVLNAIAKQYPEVKISVGIHPNEPISAAVSSSELVAWGQGTEVIAIGETGLDYYRQSEVTFLEHQRQQFRHHIQAARSLGKPLIIHTREAAEDTLAIMQAEQAHEVGGVMHCFVDTFDVAKRALDMNFYISFSGILTFKNAQQVHDVAQRVPLDRILIETDSPYLAPMPFRGKQNHPALVKYVAKALAELRGESYEHIAEITTANFRRCFRQH